ncbi:branched-chain-amino-acid transaminase [candidate division WWE3 bacterium RBG_16_37_10]|uniref:Branched-chain-amino-acid aminotransferase n=1 Tax=candidate division WWE3 bacterium RBG_16_37_10 TaxID=1802610 RepID=A0A1F4V3B2_UNCKA|nr:MAG: branched-chain-amino-acid transaminase [candidate division WWE3 bacterium RBG_16_37_10]
MTRFAYFNNEFVPYKEALIPIGTHALQYGTACFEGIRGYWNNEKERLYIFKLKDHYLRMQKSAEILHMKLPLDPDTLCEITLELIKKNGHRENIYIRPILYKSDDIVSRFNLDKLNDSFAIYTVPLGKHLNTDKGISVILSSWKRIRSNIIPPSAKPTGIYLNTCLAKTEAEAKGADEAILLNIDNTLAEGSAENIFLVKNGVLYTPSEDQNILIGITRNTIIELAKNELGISTTEKPIKKDELRKADEVFLTGTGAEVTPVILIGNKKVGNGVVGKITFKLQKIYFNIVYCKNKKYIKWLTVL